MKMVNINGRYFSKIICGTNPFYGYSHFSKARNKDYLNKFADTNITDILKFCISEGINAVESCANERIWKIVAELKLEHDVRFIGSTRIDDTSNMRSHQKKIQFLLDINADVCVIHAQFVDRPRKGVEIKGLQKLINLIHERKLLAGISTHKISTIKLCERNNYGVDLYIFPLNIMGFVYPGFEGKETVEDRINLIKQTPKPFIIIKSLAAGRIPPEEGLTFVLGNIKENDFISLGIGSREEAEESIGIIKNYLKKAIKQEQSHQI